MDSQASKHIYLTAITFYFILLTIAISLFLPGGRSDEAESMLLTQSTQWGYILRNPPLFDWLVIFTSKLFEPNVTIIFFYKMFSQWLMAVSTYYAAFKISNSQNISIATSLGSITFIHFHWYALTDLTHTLLSGAFFPLIILVLIRLKENTSKTNYFFLGIVTGLGLLTKYTFILFLLSLIVSAFFIKSYRKILFNRHIMIAVISAFLIVLPHFIWILNHLNFIDQQLVYSLETTRYTDYWDGFAAGLATISVNLVSILLFPLVFVLISFRYTKVKEVISHPYVSDDLEYLRHTLVFMSLSVLMTIALGAQEIKYHHLFYLTMVPLWLIPWLSCLSAIKITWLIKSQMIWLALVLIAYPIDQSIKSEKCKSCGAYYPYDQLATYIKDQGYRDGTVIYFNRHRQFNAPILRQYFKDSRFISTREYMYRPPERNQEGGCLMMWDKSYSQQMELLLNGENILDDIGERLRPDQYTTFIYQFEAPSKKPYSVFFALFQHGVGSCH